MPELTEIRWHARAGKAPRARRRSSRSRCSARVRACSRSPSTARSAVAHRSAPTRVSAPSRVRRHDSVEEPDLVVVLDASLLGEETVSEGVGADTTVLVNGDEQHSVGAATVRAVPTARFASTTGAGFANVAMLGAVAAELGEPPLEALQDAIVEVLGSEVAAGGAPCGRRGGIRMAELKRWQELPRAGVVGPPRGRAAARRATGARPGSRSSTRRSASTASSAGCTAPTRRSSSTGTTLTGIDYDVCKGCELCVEVCPAGAIEMVSEVAS